jgi:hypothetical protein
MKRTICREEGTVPLGFITGHSRRETWAERHRTEN